MKFFTRLAKKPITWCGLFVLWILIRSLRRRSPETRFRVARFLARMVFVCSRGPRKRIEKNLCLIRPDLDSAAIKKGSWQVAETIARSWSAMLGNGLYNSNASVRKRLTVSGIRKLLGYHRSGERVVIAVGHVGPIDDMFGVFSLYKLRAYIPVEPVRPRWLFNMMNQHREAFGDVILEPVEKGKTLERAARHLADGRIVVLTIDVTRNSPRGGVRCRIGNGVSYFPVGVAKLALGEGAIVLPVFLSVDSKGKNRMRVGNPFEITRTGNEERDIETNTRRLVEEVYAPHIQRNWNSWLRPLWANLEPAEDVN